MGAQFFFIKMKGIFKNANEAFTLAVQEAQYEEGHGGYTGTIAEKTSFKMINVPPRKDPFKFANEMEEKEGFWQDKWGPAACVEVKGAYLQKQRGEHYKGKRNFKVFYFFGWASC